jgi:hypothetical protein
MCAERIENLRCVYVSSSPSISLQRVDDFDWREWSMAIYTSSCIDVQERFFG